jgi:hypothetical protein
MMAEAAAELQTEPRFVLFNILTCRLQHTKLVCKEVRPQAVPTCAHARECYIGSLLFCPSCGTLLDLPKDGEDTVTCEQCGHGEPASCTQTSSLYKFLAKYIIFKFFWAAYDNIEITTRSHPDAFPSPLRQAKKTQTKRLESHEFMERVRLFPRECCSTTLHIPSRSRKDVQSVDTAKRTLNNSRFVVVLRVYALH